MTMNVYQTAATRMYDVKKLGLEIERAKVNGGLIQAFVPTSNNNNANVPNVFLLTDNDVTPFSHPFTLGDTVVFDGRPYLREEARGSYQLTNATEYRFQLERAILTSVINKEGSDTLNYLGYLPGVVFVRWLSTAIGRRLGLEPADQMTLITLVLFYWHDLLNDGATMKESQRLHIARNWSTKVGASPNSAVDLGTLEPMTKLDELIAAIKEHVPSDRTDALSVGLVLSLLGGSWFGTNVNELVAVATEHPPTFVAMVNAAVENRSFRKSVIGTLTYDNSKRGMGEQFQKGMRVWLGDYF